MCSGSFATPLPGRGMILALGSYSFRVNRKDSSARNILTLGSSERVKCFHRKVDSLSLTLALGSCSGRF